MKNKVGIIICYFGKLPNIFEVEEFNYIHLQKRNGGNVDIISKTVTNNSTYGKLPTPYRDYYVFDGWYTAPKDGNKITESSKVSLSKNQTLYAHWKL